MSDRGISSPPQSSMPFGPATLLLGAGALVLYGLTRGSKSGLALATAGGVLAYKAAQQPAPQSSRAVFLINASADRAYSLWRNFEQLPRFMAHLKSVRVLDTTRSEWTALAPGDRTISWNAELTDDQPNRRIAWRSLPGSTVETSGSVEFRPDPQNRGTFVTAEVFYNLPGGIFASAAATVAGKSPDFVVREDLRRFKALLEANEAPTTAGQTHGPRGAGGHTKQVLFRETSNHPQPQAVTA